MTANTALSGFLLMSALGVLIGGWIAGRMTHHRFIAALGLSVTALTMLGIGAIIGTGIFVLTGQAAGKPVRPDCRKLRPRRRAGIFQ